jgi:hypothetical protein
MGADDAFDLANLVGRLADSVGIGLGGGAHGVTLLDP